MHQGQGSPGAYQNHLSAKKQSQPQRRLTSAKINSKTSPSRQQRPYSAKPSSAKTPQIGLGHHAQIQPPQSIYLGHSQLHQHQSVSVQQIGNIPVKAAIPVLNRKNFSKLMPSGEPKQSKEDLYAAALHSKMEANALREENLRLQTRLSFVESRLALQDSSGNVGMLLKQLNACKTRCTALAHDNRSQQQLLKSTVISEVRAENELYKQELIRLRLMLECGLGGGLRALVKKQANSDNTAELFKYNQELEYKLANLRKFNIEQNKRNLVLATQLSTQEQSHQQQIFQINERLNKDTQIIRQEVQLFYQKQIAQLQHKLSEGMARVNGQDNQSDQGSEEKTNVLVARHECELLDIQMKLSQQMKEAVQKIEEAHKEKVQEIHAYHEVALFDARTQVKQDMEASLQKKLESQVVQQTDSSDKLKLNTEINELKAQLQQLQESQKLAVLKKRKNSDSYSSASSHSHEAPQDSELKRLQGQLAESQLKYDTQVELNEAFSKEVNLMQDQLTEQDEYINKMIRDHCQELVDKEHKHKQVEETRNSAGVKEDAQVPEIYADFESQIQFLTDQIEEMKQIHRQEVNEIWQEVEAGVQDLAESRKENKDLMAAMTDTHQDYQSQINFLAMHHQAKIREKNIIIALFKRRLEKAPKAEVVVDYSKIDDSEVARLLSEKHSEIDQLKEAHSQEVSQLEREMFDEVEESAAELAQTRKDLKEKVDTIGETHLEYQQKITFLVHKIHEKNLVIAMFKKYLAGRQKKPQKEQTSVVKQPPIVQKPPPIELTSDQRQLLKSLRSLLITRGLETDLCKSLNEEDNNNTGLLTQDQIKNAIDKVMTNVPTKQGPATLSSRQHSLLLSAVTPNAQDFYNWKRMISLIFGYKNGQNMVESVSQPDESLNNADKYIVALLTEQAKQVMEDHGQTTTSNSKTTELLSGLAEAQHRDYLSQTNYLVDEMTLLMQEHRLEIKRIENLLYAQEEQSANDLANQRQVNKDLMLSLTETHADYQSQLRYLEHYQLQKIREKNLIILLFKKQILKAQQDPAQIEDKASELVAKIMQNGPKEMRDTGYLVDQIENLKLTHKIELEELHREYQRDVQQKITQLAQAQLDQREVETYMSQTQSEYQTQIEFMRSNFSQDIREKTMAIAMFKRIVEEINERHAREIEKLQDDHLAQIQEFVRVQTDYVKGSHPAQLTVVPVFSAGRCSSPLSSTCFDRADSAQQKDLLHSLVKQPTIIQEQDDRDSESNTGRQLHAQIQVKDLDSDMPFQAALKKETSISDSKAVNEMTSDTMTPVKGLIRQALLGFKRKLQIGYIKSEMIAKAIFEKEFDLDRKVEIPHLAVNLKQMMDQQPAELLAMYLVDVASAQTNKNVTSSQQSSEQTAAVVTQSQVVEALISLLDQHCGGVQIYSQQKDRKMKLIIGQALSSHPLLSKEAFTSVSHFESRLTEHKIASETIDCAIVYLLRMSASSQVELVSSVSISQFISECKKEANSFSMTGMSFPLQDELLEYSLSSSEDQSIQQDQPDEHYSQSDEEDDGVEFNDRQAMTPDLCAKSPDTFKPVSVTEGKLRREMSGGSFDSGRAADSIEDLKYEEPRDQVTILDEAAVVHENATGTKTNSQQYDSQFELLNVAEDHSADVDGRNSAGFKAAVPLENDYSEYSVHEASNTQQSVSAVQRSMKHQSQSSVEPVTEPVQFNAFPPIDAHRATQKGFDDDDERYSEEQEEMGSSMPDEVQRKFFDHGKVDAGDQGSSFGSSSSNNQGGKSLGVKQGETGVLETKFLVNEDLNF